MQYFKRLQPASILKLPKIVKVLCVQQFFEGFVPITALFAIMFSRIGHLEFKQIGWLFSIWSLGYLISEIPSGVLADYWSHKKVVMIGNFLKAAGFVFWIVWPSFGGYAIGFGLWGVAIACTSGAMSAYLHNELRHDGEGKYFAKYYGYVNSSNYVGMFLGFILAAIFTLSAANLLIVLSSVSSLIAGFILFLHPERAYPRQDTYLKTLKSGLHEFMTSKRLRYLCYCSFAVLMVIGVLEELLPRLYSSIGLVDTQVALLAAVTLITTIVLVAKLEVFINFSIIKQLFIMSLGLISLIVGLAMNVKGSFILLLLFGLIFQIFRPVFQHHILQEVKGEERATVGSIPGLAAGLLGALAYSIIGWVADASSERFSIGLYGLFWLIVLVFLMLYGLKYRVSVKSRVSKNALRE